MNANKLSDRLQTVASFVKPNSRIADIGSDHAYLPVFLARNEQIQFAIASEVAKGPHENATHEILQQDVKNLVSSRLGNGLDVVTAEDQVNTISIAGMGGTLISQILERGKNKLQGVSNLILQPNVGENGVRKWLMQNNYRITAERILKEDHHIYEIIVAENKPAPTYSEKELLFGPKLLQILPNAIFQEKWLAELQRIKNAIAQMKQAQVIPKKRISKLKHKADLIKEVLDFED
ncbi:Putative tRNA-m1A22 methylase [Pediococcus damnosus]|uniref:tRNA (adenine(22)-N(1))-methyltransferase n=1 Tax=Pediococcus damnosus TaxID=51663 RepID=UPI00078BA805|nr:tRNA (adenine(22)-N(1))-methyltransferase TrmK [Pediococcus damnosus]AMV61576.1 Putative tRNA-m1A22 methylase [Pediococcus damnosus]AMV65938.1 Putative tRNA-m1A22 methylase [Pediococcus damnosus]